MNAEVTNVVKEDHGFLYRWIGLGDATKVIYENSIAGGGDLMTRDLSCKYLNARIDMRTGNVRLMPGNEPHLEHQYNLLKKRCDKLERLLRQYHEAMGAIAMTSVTALMPMEKDDATDQLPADHHRKADASG